MIFKEKKADEILNKNEANDEEPAEQIEKEEVKVEEDKG